MIVQYSEKIGPPSHNNTVRLLLGTDCRVDRALAGSVRTLALFAFLLLL